MAMAVSRIVNDCLDGQAARVRRIGGRFRAMVRMPSKLTLALVEPRDDVFGFRLVTPDGEPAIDQGYVVADSADR